MPSIVTRLSVCFLLAFHVSVFAQSTTSLSGTIQDFDKGSNITLSPLSGNEQKSVVISSDGAFYFKVAPKGGELYFLGYTSHQQDHSAVVYLEKGTETNIAINNFYITLWGYPLAEEQNLFYKQTYSIAKESRDIDSALQTAIDSVTKRNLAYRKKQIENELQSFYTQWVLTHKQSPFSLAVIYLYLQDTNAALTKSLFSQLLEGAKENNTVTDVMPYLFARQEANEKLKVGEVIPDFILSDTSGNQQSFYNLKGDNYALLDIWASWCNPCRKSMSDIQKLIKLYSNKNFKVISVSADTEKEAWTKAVKEERMNWSQLSDLKGTDSGFIHEKAIYEFPTYIFISPQGKILSKPYTIERVKEVLDTEFISNK